MASYNQPVEHKFDQWLRNTEDYEEKWRKDNNENYSYYDGDQWSEDEIETIESRGQQATVLNVMRPTIDMVLALESELKTSTQVVGREESDSLTARLLTELLSQTFDQNDKNYYTSQSFRQGLIGGRGWIFVHPEVDEDDEIQIKVDHLPWEEVYIDPHHQKPDGSDARFILRKQWEDRDIIEEKWPEQGKKIEDMITANDDENGFKGIEYGAQQNETNRIQRGEDDGVTQYYDQKTDRVLLIHCWYRDAKGVLRYVLFAGNVFLVGEDPALEGKSDANNEDPIGINMFPLIPFTAFRKREGEPQGLVRLIRDPQDQVNKLNSKYLFNACSNRVMMEEDATDDPEELHAQWNKPNGLAKVSSGALNKVRTDDNARELNGLSNQLQFMLNMIQKISGVNDSMLGVGAVNERSAQQGRQRIAQGSRVQTSILENFYFTNKRIAQVTLRQIAAFYDTERIIRITEPNGEISHLKVNQPIGIDEDGEPIIFANINDVLKYDVIMKEVAPFDSTKELSLQYLTEAGKAGVIEPLVLAELLIGLSDTPHKEELIARNEQLYNQRQAQEQALAQQQQQSQQQI